MSFRIQVDTAECMSSGKCVADFPTAFAFDDEELATITNPDTLGDAEMLRAARNCPSRALSVIDEDGTAVAT